MPSPAYRQPQQTIESGRLSDTGEVLLATSLLSMSETDLTLLRRRTNERRHRPELGPPYIVCTVCGTPLFISRRGTHGQHINRFFRHAQPAECPWYDPSRYTAEEIMALRFHAQREGAEHRRLKRLLVDALQSDPEVEEVFEEQVFLGQVLKGEWKIPDVRCRWRGRTVVFELQLSYTFISEVVKRDTFYAAEECFIIWVFSQPNPQRAVVIEETYYNHRNLFVFDPDAQQASREEGKLVLNCWHTVPLMHQGCFIEEQREQLVTLCELTYPTSNFRPFYFDYDEVRSRLLREQLERRGQEEAAAVAASLPPPAKPDAVAPLPPACPYRQLVNAILKEGAVPSHQPAGPATAQAVAALPTSDERERAALYLEEPWFSAVVRLVSIANAKPLMTKYTTIYEVLASVLQSSATAQRRFAYLYCECWAAYRPWMKPLQTSRILGLRRQIADAVAAGDPEYVPNSDFALFVSRLLPSINLSIPTATTPPTLPSIRWSPYMPARDVVSLVGQRYLKTHPETDWRAVYRRALSLRDTEVPTAIETLSEVSGARPGDIQNFLTSCRLLYRPKPPYSR